MRRSLPMLAVALLVTAPALADLPPPPGFVEKCTVNKQLKAGETCESCRDSYHADRNACRKKLEPKGYAYRCRTRGASVWTEIWCRAKGAEPKPVKLATGDPKKPADDPATTLKPVDEPPKPANTGAEDDPKAEPPKPTEDTAKADPKAEPPKPDGPAVAKGEAPAPAPKAAAKPTPSGSAGGCSALIPGTNGVALFLAMALGFCFVSAGGGRRPPR